ncbi:MAG: Chromosomal replication initiator, DnaA C-terminal domain [Bryobacterales bacterium]|nr:Chromosomal replication initiator, DnaA C-terminal domain [Bryobacterales bacterium]
MFAKECGRIWPISLHQIEATVSAYLGPGRVAGNRQDAAFSRQVAMYLAKHVGRWSTPKIGKFYNGRHHTTVLYSIEKIERLRERDASLDALLELFCAELSAWSTHAGGLSAYRCEASVEGVDLPLPSPFWRSISFGKPEERSVSAVETDTLLSERLIRGEQRQVQRASPRDPV